MNKLFILIGLLVSTAAFAEELDLNADLELIRLKDSKKIIIMIDGIERCKIADSQLTEKNQTLTCDPGYKLIGKTVVGFFKSTYAYFELYEIGSLVLLDREDVEIISRPFKVDDPKYPKG